MRASARCDDVAGSNSAAGSTSGRERRCRLVDEGRPGATQGLGEEGEGVGAHSSSRAVGWNCTNSRSVRSCTGPPGQREAVAGRLGRVGRARQDLADAAGGEDDRPGAAEHEASVPVPGEDAGTRVGRPDEFEGERVLEDGEGGRSGSAERCAQGADEFGFPWRRVRGATRPRECAASRARSSGYSGRGRQVRRAREPGGCLGPSVGEPWTARGSRAPPLRRACPPRGVRGVPGAHRAAAMPPCAERRCPCDRGRPLVRMSTRRSPRPSTTDRPAAPPPITTTSGSCRVGAGSSIVPAGDREHPLDGAAGLRGHVRGPRDLVLHRLEERQDLRQRVALHVGAQVAAAGRTPLREARPATLSLMEHSVMRTTRRPTVGLMWHHAGGGANVMGASQDVRGALRVRDDSVLRVLALGRPASRRR